MIGRFTFLDGSEVTPKNATLTVLKRDRVNQRLIGDYGFSDVGRSFDGLRYSFAAPSDNFTFIAGVPTRGVLQVDGWGWNRVGLGYQSYTHSTNAARHATASERPRPRHGLRQAVPAGGPGRQRGQACIVRA